MIAAAARDGAAWLAAEKAADESQSALGGKDVTLLWDNNKHTREINFLGYEYTINPSPISNGSWIVYDPKKPQVWKVPLLDEIVPVIAVKAPRGGYVVPAAFAKEIAEKLKLHGIEFVTLKETRAASAVESFRATKAEAAKATFEGRTRMSLEGAWAADTRVLLAGSLFVPIAQPKALLVMQLFEPVGPDSFVAWGFFNAAFEQKEYMEAYVAEQVARDLLTANPALQKEFDARIAADPEFAKDAEKRLDFFYQRSPSWDERYNLVPTYRVERAP